MEQIKKIKILRKAQKCNKIKEKSISIKSVLVRSVGILLARGIPTEGIAPFGAAFMTVERRFSIEAQISAAMAIAGAATIFDLPTALYQIGCIVAYLLFLFVSDRESGDISLGAAIGAATVISLLVGGVMLIWNGVSSGGVIKVFAQAVLTAAGGFVLDKNRGILSGNRQAVFSMNNEEKLCLAVVGAMVIMGLKSLKLGEWLNIGAVVGLWLTFQFSLCGGLGAGAATGVFSGLLSGSLDTALVMSATFALMGGVSGFLAEKGKNRALLAGAFAGIAAVLICNEAGTAVGYFDIPLGFGAAVLTSDSIYRNIGRIMGIKSRCDEGRCRDYIKTKLSDAADSFRVLASTFFELSNNDESRGDESLMLDGITEKVCRHCSKISTCWVSRFDSTYNSFLNMIEVTERKGELSESDADECFSGRCLRCRRVSTEMNRLFEIYKINRVWRSKLCENRELAGQQLASVAQILDRISDELNEERIDSQAEEEIRTRLYDKKIEATEIEVSIGSNGKYFAYIGAIADENAETARRGAESALHSVLGTKMAMVGASRRDRGEILMRFAQPEGFMVEAGFASKNSGDVSGDNCVMRYLSDGKYAAALSDGMGTGVSAARDSKATVKVLGDFLEAGFDRETAVRLVNSIMVMKSAEEAFATVDMCVIDLYSGEAEFIKNGAEASYIKRGGDVETVRAATLPVGVVRDMEIERFAHKLTAGVIIVMLSDGLNTKEGYEEWIKETVEEADPEIPSQELADRIMDIAENIHGDGDTDDMSVMVLKLLERD